MFLPGHAELQSHAAALRLRLERGRGAAGAVVITYSMDKWESNDLRTRLQHRLAGSTSTEGQTLVKDSWEGLVGKWRINEGVMGCGQSVHIDMG